MRKTVRAGAIGFQAEHESGWRTSTAERQLLPADSFL
jgi:hypothetical protein